MVIICCSKDDVDCSGNVYFVLPLLCLLTICFVFLLTFTAVCWRERGESEDS